MMYLRAEAPGGDKNNHNDSGHISGSGVEDDENEANAIEIEKMDTEIGH